MSTLHQTSVVSTPLPVPSHFSHAEQSFSLKKRKPPFSSSSSSLSPPWQLSHCLPSRRQSKACPSVSRVFPHRPSPWTPLSQSLLELPPPLSVYDPFRHESFFNQCFTNLGLIGRGSFGEVFKVVSLLDGREYAVKRSVQRFRSEAERAKCIEEACNHEQIHPHPFVLGFVAAWEEASHLYIQTELCCTSLLLYAEDSPLHTGEKRAWMYMCDMLSALSHIHACGFVHLDVKPANFFITNSGRLKLGDFGLLIKLPTNTQEEATAENSGMHRQDLQEGDPRYMAPELLKGDYRTAADIFSLGVSILELACNIEIPKGGDNWQLLRKGHLPAEATNVLSEDMQNILQLMLCPEPSNRATANQLLSLPSVRRRKCRRQVSLCIIESIFSFFQWCQCLLAIGWNFISSFNLPFESSVCAPSSTSTPPKESWERDLNSVHNCVFTPDDCEHSPSFSHRVRDSLLPGKTSTPLHDRHRDVMDTSQNHSTDSPHRISSLSLLEDSPQHSLTDERLVNTKLSEKSSFEPKNLLSLFEESASESDL
ncbi:hypothetical protein DNTS_028668 [Danionella cerebrum]|uniref:non-specific serine/threonine protein kinase n=1 Tax=Danionella cerebrum TaxID=2873325 RepID=A0A553MYH8_9TELE|nr:hypothetical protein DNTS_028668 [Danionella translucida]